MTKKITVCLCFIFVLEIHAQNQPLYTLFDVCKNYYNPAFTAYECKTSAYMAGTYQYKNYSPYPMVSTYFYPLTEKKFILDLSTPIKIKGKQKLGIGFNYSRIDQQFEVKNNFRLNLSYMQEIGKGRLLFGANLDRMSHQLKFPEYDIFNPAITIDWQSVNTGFGLAYHSNLRNFYIGISSNYLLPNTIYVKESNPPFSLSYHKDLYLMSGIDIKLNKNLTLKPSFCWQYRDVSSISTNVLAEYKTKYKIGFTYQTGADLAGIRLGYQIKSFGIDYVYNLALSKIISVSTGMHTVGLHYTLNKIPTPPNTVFNKPLPTHVNP